MNQLMPGVSNYIDSVLVIISDLCCEVIAAPSLRLIPLTQVRLYVVS